MDVVAQDDKGWELIDSGDGRKLERFGRFMLDRPSPGAIWRKDENAPWNEAAAHFTRRESGTGDWRVLNRSLPDAWIIDWQRLRFEIRLTAFGNVGIFPEHSAHWPWMRSLLETRREPTVLNLFGYTGGASLACAQAGAHVTHVDAAKSVNGWARLNMELSRIEGGLRFLADDAVKFVRRERRRERAFDGLIIDPPTFGRGPRGEMWKVERSFIELMEECLPLLSTKPLFVLISSHSPGITPAVLRELLASYGGNVEAGEMLLSPTQTTHQLPQGCYARWTP